MFDKHRRRRQLRRVKPGDGSPLPNYRFWQLFHRTLFFLEREDPDGAASSNGPSGPNGGAKSSTSSDASVYAVDVRYLADEIEDGWLAEDRSAAPPVALYLDGVQIHRANPPAAFLVPGGAIEVATSLYGLTRMHYVPDDGPARMLRPHRWSLEGLRARFGRRFPRVSTMIGVLAVLILLVGLVVGIPQVAEMITQLDVVAERVGTFTSPIHLPDWANTTLLIAGIIAATERALTLRNHWLIDADTTWTSY